MKIHLSQLKYLIPIIAFGFLFYKARGYVDSVTVHISSINYPLLILSYLALLLVFIADAYGWHLILKSLSSKLRFSSTMPIWFYSAFSRYIPGVIWPYATRIKLSSDAGIDKLSIANSMLLENLFLALTSLLIGIPLALKALGTQTTLLMISIAFFGLLLSKPISHLILRLSFTPEIIKKLINNLHQTSLTTLVKLALFYSLFWFFFSVTFAVFCIAITPSATPLQHIAYVAACFPVSFFVGFVATISPGGLGIREGALYSMLVLFIEPGSSALIAIASRLWIVFAEVSIGLILVLLHYQKRKQPHK